MNPTEKTKVIGMLTIIIAFLLISVIILIFVGSSYKKETEELQNKLKYTQSLVIGYKNILKQNKIIDFPGWEIP